MLLYLGPSGAAQLPQRLAKTAISTATVALDLRLPGQWLQDETGLHRNGQRDYDPSLGRYIEPDPLGIEAGQNLYSYVDGRPTDWSDPRGLQVAPSRLGGPIPFPLPPIAIPGTRENRAWTNWALNLFKGRYGGGTHPDPDCEKEWQEARDICANELSKPNPNCRITGGYRDIESWARGLVSERCGGNTVTK